MKKVVTGFFALTIFIITSCSVRTCPTYTQAPLETPNQEEINC